MITFESYLYKFSVMFGVLLSSTLDSKIGSSGGVTIVYSGSEVITGSLNLMFVSASYAFTVTSEICISSKFDLKMVSFLGESLKV